MRLALIGLNQVPLDWYGNLRRIELALAHARKEQAQIMVFPELAITGYGCEDMFLHPDTAKRAMDMLLTLAPQILDEVVLLGLPFYFEEELYNGVAVINGGKVCAIGAKSHLPREGIHYEPRWFKPWPNNEQRVMQVGGASIPVGVLSYLVNDLPFAIEICEDGWVRPELRPCRAIADAQWVFNCSASHFSMGKADLREKLVCQSSQNFQIGYAYANLVGCESGRAIYDGELLVAHGGKIINRSDRLYLNEVRVLCTDLPYRPSHQAEGDVVLQVALKEQIKLPEAQTQRASEDLEVEFAEAASLALFDYMRKSRANGFTLSLSGGVDSSVVAVLVHLMAQRVLTELNLEERKAELGHLKALNLEATSAQELTGQLITTVYQATRNSGDVTKNAASSLAHAIGARHLELDVDPLVEGYKAMVSGAIERPLSWETDDIALQNIQARVRAPGVWMIANLRGSLLLSTSNRSEVAVGYATMDGDTCGGLSPIAGVEKTFLRQWLRRIEAQGLPKYKAIPELVHVNQQAPTAELRPPDQVQKDEDDLMPYEVLDALEEALIAHRLPPMAAFHEVKKEFPQYEAETLKHWTIKFCRMFSITQWKRERYAPAFHLDDRNLDPKTWARYPILSGAFAKELAELGELK